jgi:iron(III) transport system substrate-binding protein
MKYSAVFISAFLSLLAACSSAPAPDTLSNSADGPTAQAENKILTVYSGREEKIMAPLIEKAEAELGIKIEVRYGDSTELAIALTEEGNNSPADLYYSQDSGALGAVANAGLALPLPEKLLEKVDAKYQSPKGDWIGISGRARVLDYNSELVSADELPDSVLDLTDPRWRGKIGWATGNGSFQAFVTAMRAVYGNDATLKWLEGMKANEPKNYDGNTAIVEALGKGEVSVGLVNNYYLYRFKAKDPSFPVELHHFKDGDVGALVNAAGLAVIKTTDQPEDARAFVEYMLSEEAQQFLTNEFYEYPLVKGIDVSQNQKPLEDLTPPNLDLNKLSDIEGSVVLLQKAGLL